jgi:hypothetical protein
MRSTAAYFASGSWLTLGGDPVSSVTGTSSWLARRTVRVELVQDPGVGDALDQVARLDKRPRL